MFDWYSEYVMARARQAELVGAAELRRRLGEVAAATRARPREATRRRAAPPESALSGGGGVDPARPPSSGCGAGAAAALDSRLR